MKKQLLTFLVAVLLIISCSKKDDKPSTTIDQEKVSLNYDQTHQFKLTAGSTAVDASKVTWTSSDQTVGTINASGLFSAKRIGNTTIKAVANGSTLTSEVSIIPYSELCKEPVLEFGASLATIKSKETRVLIEQTSTALMYNGENSKVENIFYGFNASGLESSVLLLSSSAAVVDESEKFFSERYEFVGETVGLFFFEDSKTTVGLGFVQDLGFVAVYFENSLSAKSFAQGKNTKEKLKAIKQAFVETSNSVKLIQAK